MRVSLPCFVGQAIGIRRAGRPRLRRGAGRGVRRARETGIPHRCDEHGSLHVGFAGFDIKTGDSLNSFGAVLRLRLEHS